MVKPVRPQPGSSQPVYLVTRRLQLGYSQAALAAATHVAQGTISKLERLASGRPSASVIFALARELQVNPELLRFGPNPRTLRAARAAKRDADREALLEKSADPADQDAAEDGRRRKPHEVQPATGGR